MCVSLPLPVKTIRKIDIVFHPMAQAGQHVMISKVRLEIPISGIAHDIKLAAQALFNVHPDRLYLREIFHHK
jgi:hypothetical protein